MPRYLTGLLTGDVERFELLPVRGSSVTDYLVASSISQRLCGFVLGCPSPASQRLRHGGSEQFEGAIGVLRGQFEVSAITQHFEIRLVRSRQEPTALRL